MSMLTGFVPLFPPANVEIIVMQNSRYRLVVAVDCDWEPDLAGWYGTMIVKAERTEDAATLANLSAYVSVLGLPANQVVIDINASAPELAGVDWTEGVYDVVIAPVGEPARGLRPVGGSFRINIGVNP